MNAMLPNVEAIRADVHRALNEDVGSGDVSAALISAEQRGTATVLTRECAVFCGREWATETFQAVDSSIELHWSVADGDDIAADQVLLRAYGPARTLVTGERTSINFMQTLSGTATITRRFVDLVSHTGVRLIDTRKTVPGLRRAQKYAVRCGGASNHRMGLFDAYLIKENHIAATGGIARAIALARQNHPELPLQVEVENERQLRQAIDAEAPRILLDNFSIDGLRRAVEINDGRSELEASGGISLSNVAAVAESGVDCISIGELTKDIRAIDISMRLESL